MFQHESPKKQKKTAPSTKIPILIFKRYLNFLFSFLGYVRNGFSFFLNFIYFAINKKKINFLENKIWKYIFFHPLIGLNYAQENNPLSTALI